MSLHNILPLDIDCTFNVHFDSLNNSKRCESLRNALGRDEPQAGTAPARQPVHAGAAYRNVHHDCSCGKIVA